MSQKNLNVKHLDVKNPRPKSRDEMEIRSSQHSKNKRTMAQQLRSQIEVLINKKDKADQEALKSYKKYKQWKESNNDEEADFHYRCYKTWSDEAHSIQREIQRKLIAVHKYQEPAEEQGPQIASKKQEELGQTRKQ